MQNNIINDKNKEISTEKIYDFSLFLILSAGVIGTLLLIFHRIEYFGSLMIFLILGTIIVAIYYLNQYRFSNLFTKSSSFLFLILLLAYYYRTPTSYFVFSIGDAGAYVNSSWSILYNGYDNSHFFILNKIYLTLFGDLFGEQNIYYSTLFFALFTIVSIYKLIYEIFKSERMALIAALLFSVNILSAWTSRISYSEILMVFININILYYYLKIFNSTKIDYLKSFIFILLIFAASFNRVTGILWILILIGDFIYHLVVTKKDLFRRLLFLNAAYFVYILSVIYALKYLEMYYIGWQLKEFFPHVTLAKIIYVHLFLFLFFNISYFLLRNRIIINILKIPYKNIMFLTALIVLFIVGSYTLHVSDEYQFYRQFWYFIIGHENSIDFYYFKNYFGLGAIPLMILGYFIFFKKFSLVSNTEYSIFWFFSLLFLLLYYKRVVYIRPHDVYLYWDRYYYSEVFLVHFIAFIAGMLYWKKHIVFRLVISIGIMFYLAQSVYWIKNNRIIEYMENAYKTLYEIDKFLPSEKKEFVILLDFDDDLKWFFPNFKNSFLFPLRSKGYNVVFNHQSKSCFDADAHMEIEKVSQYIKKGKYVILLHLGSSIADEKLLNTVFEIKKIAQINNVISIKSHNQYNIFHKHIKKYPIYIDMYKLQNKTLNISKKENFHTDKIWTKKQSVIHGINYKINNERTLILQTYGWNHYKSNLDKLNLEVHVNDMKLEFEQYKNNRYYFLIPENFSIINTITIKVNPFIPSKIDKNNKDKRELGIDLKTIFIQ